MSTSALPLRISDETIGFIYVKILLLVKPDIPQEGRTIVVLWDPPVAGAAPTGYVVNVTGSFTGSVAAAGRQLSGTVGPGTYVLAVAATNPCGTSAASPALPSSRFTNATCVSR